MSGTHGRELTQAERACGGFKMEENKSLEELCGIIARLRGENGCPWDRVQTHESLIPCMIEEAYETVEGIRILTETGDGTNLCEELGDVLMQVIFHSQLAEEKGEFTLDEVIRGISEKMIRRHPHVFGDGTKRDWESLKREEKGALSPQEELASVPRAFPALLRASKTLKKLEGIYGEYADARESLKNVYTLTEKLLAGEERSKEITGGAGALKQEEKEALIGRALLELCNYARLQGVNSEILLARTLENERKAHEIRQIP